MSKSMIIIVFIQSTWKYNRTVWDPSIVSKVYRYKTINYRQKVRSGVKVLWNLIYIYRKNEHRGYGVRCTSCLKEVVCSGNLFLLFLLELSIIQFTLMGSCLFGYNILDSIHPRFLQLKCLNLSSYYQLSPTP